MKPIVRANTNDVQLLSEMAATTFIESMGHSGPAADINQYVAEKYQVDVLRNELTDPKNIYHFIYQDEQPAGYSKIVLDGPCPDSEIKNLTKMDRLYVFKEFYGSNVGRDLFDFNIDLSKNNGQSGMWLYTWKENYRAIRFYEKKGFVIIGSFDFPISKTHVNPNHCILLLY